MNYFEDLERSEVTAIRMVPSKVGVLLVHLLVLLGLHHSSGEMGVTLAQGSEHFLCLEGPDPFRRPEVPEIQRGHLGLGLPGGVA